MDGAWSVRAAAEGDIDRIAEIKVRNWGDTYGALVPAVVLGPFLDVSTARAEMREHLESPDTILLVGERGRGGVQGFALTYLTQSPEPWLESLHVVAEERGHGLGAELIRATALRIIDAGYRSMSLGVILGNDAPGAFYVRLGAVADRVEVVHWAPGVSHTVYRWPDLGAMRRLADPDLRSRTSPGAGSEAGSDPRTSR